MLSWFLIIFFFSCQDENNTVAPYANTRLMSDIQVEGGTFHPNVTWAGGYVSTLGINIGSVAALDTTLIWIIHIPEDDLRFPVKYGDLPDGAEDLTSHYGGTTLDSLIEDSSYTFWVMKEEAWLKVANENGKILLQDTSSTSSSVTIINDSIFVGSGAHAQLFTYQDVYINLNNIKPVGRLANIFIEQPRTSNNPIISWEIKQSEVIDTLVAAVGIIRGQTYNAERKLWEVYADTTSEISEYGKINIIETPFICGQSFDGTRVFVKYPDGGLKRNEDYYIWIANKDWDGVGRRRSTNYYAFITFHTW
jgi:hypothetical protein